MAATKQMEEIRAKREANYLTQTKQKEAAAAAAGVGLAGTGAAVVGAAGRALAAGRAVAAGVGVAGRAVASAVQAAGNTWSGITRYKEGEIAYLFNKVSRPEIFQRVKVISGNEGQSENVEVVFVNGSGTTVGNRKETVSYTKLHKEVAGNEIMKNLVRELSEMPKYGWQRSVYDKIYLESGNFVKAFQEANRFVAGDEVYVVKDEKYMKGKVVESLSNGSYEIKVYDGKVIQYPKDKVVSVKWFDRHKKQIEASLTNSKTRSMFEAILKKKEDSKEEIDISQAKKYSDEFHTFTGGLPVYYNLHNHLVDNDNAMNHIKALKEIMPVNDAEAETRHVKSYRNALEDKKSHDTALEEIRKKIKNEGYDKRIQSLSGEGAYTALYKKLHVHGREKAVENIEDIHKLIGSRRNHAAFVNAYDHLRHTAQYNHAVAMKNLEELHKIHKNLNVKRGHFDGLGTATTLEERARQMNEYRTAANIRREAIIAEQNAKRELQEAEEERLKAERLAEAAEAKRVRASRAAEVVESQRSTTEQVIGPSSIAVPPREQILAHAPVVPYLAPHDESGEDKIETALMVGGAVTGVASFIMVAVSVLR
jgi:hypothetical protein